MLWRAEINVDGVLVDATRWTDNPARACRDGIRLAEGRYWVTDDQPRWGTAA